MEIVIMLYDGITALDAIGPYEVFAAESNNNIKFVAKTKGLIKLDSKMGYLHADYNFNEITSADILIIPGCRPPNFTQLMKDEETLNWILQIHKTTKWTTTVCTGSLILGATGLLNGVNATSHWSCFNLLRSLGAIPTKERFVRHEKIITAAGVSAGIDMALQLIAWEFGDEKSKAVQLMLEYDPQPPFDTGSPKKAHASLLEDLNLMIESLNNKV
ncbi:4-methyl-5(B-hydroxyethyl)-thiazole monophosphate biosynthesis protein [Bacillus thuringiensis]|uniref:4-methyl-5(B-hydroxyethyl)-thiazole monophosphate biosynthesis protein n=1 Tax=Bacillus thuringiensis TaxID=1428 RepID=A0A9X6YFS0_BACTU|nr:DJ-1/PfpI family protein [Bacillus thuringiensis]PEC71600.1 4-methyl-5(B-hydroxyethyl)-thiazole monophosphate biosynthesis protein [Bacillus thuringiensis]PED12956.1 4-methyl-5(B-hydroxyethyl)-thiazole monophosphate biosynthesis protein [Bacillus thuringiensis]PEF84468.1 4-methyl-5(B-hydroxyethyl)-thiazole monophosphate biosynthesis protein [Bacillus thuringiensis]PES60238.1 4-methyl-5(B-hydroxyethyl)-thiazole monophosphate biosynthesis protein [Bacillus thuringiensis]PFC25245.1 4-methyl-5(